MSYDIPSTEPVRIIAGATVKWTRALADFLPADGWVLTYAFKRTGATATTVTCTDNGDGTHLATISSTTTAGMSADTYYWQAIVAKGDEKWPADSGRLIVEANLATADAAQDPRSPNQKICDALGARVEGRVTADQESLSIEGIAISRIPFTEAVRLYREYRALCADEVTDERVRRGLPIAGAPRIRF